ncbi:UvrB/UvrC motif-containing protein [Paenibacillus aurantius]|uniref:UvrB/UvrC motif-containing protein n=1 Tax=Paenibacillus aurantius TaxID=2918900 RepID=A0AA96LEE4_9BACL|nr:UvrB/UvrC motif-containing protein [Paenibacillus aurantius]WNQ11708.1 UvrB/UvrC motif-containing protein [Paenibacillus aurantius]
MNCQECGKRPATLHFTKIVNGEKTEFHICEACAREKGELIPGTPNGFSIHNLLSGLLHFDPANPVNTGAKPPSPSLRCEECGLTYSQFSKLGRFGCSSCYNYFADRMDPLFKRVHGSTSHTGKVPKRAGGRIQFRRDIENLRKDMADYIEKEEFERAAKVRDQIRELEKKVSEM